VSVYWALLLNDEDLFCCAPAGDLTDNRIVLDRRVLDNAVGLDSEINELVEGSGNESGSVCACYSRSSLLVVAFALQICTRRR
jgi:hypothetical protein